MEYISPQIEIITFEAEDVVLLSVTSFTAFRDNELDTVTEITGI